MYTPTPASFPASFRRRICRRLRIDRRPAVLEAIDKVPHICHLPWSSTFLAVELALRDVTLVPVTGGIPEAACSAARRPRSRRRICRRWPRHEALAVFLVVAEFALVPECLRRISPCRA